MAIHAELIRSFVVDLLRRRKALDGQGAGCSAAVFYSFVLRLRRNGWSWQHPGLPPQRHGDRRVETTFVTVTRSGQPPRGGAGWRRKTGVRRCHVGTPHELLAKSVVEPTAKATRDDGSRYGLMEAACEYTTPRVG